MLSPFRYPGGKTWLMPTIRPWLEKLATESLHLVEPFAGGAIVGLTAALERLAQRVTLVEIDQDVAAVWKVILSSEAESFAQRV